MVAKTDAERAALVAQWKGLALWIAGRVCRNRPWCDVEDVAQEVFIAFYALARSHDPSKGSFSTWACPRGFQVAITYARREGHHGVYLPESAWDEFHTAFIPIMPGSDDETRGFIPEHAIADPGRDETEVIEGDEQWAELVAGLGDDERRVIELRFRDGMTFPEIAEATGFNASQAQLVYSRAIGRLRERYGVGAVCG